MEGEKKQRKKPKKYEYTKPNKPNGKINTGRPSKYDIKYCQDMIDFMERTTHEIVVDHHYYPVAVKVQEMGVKDGIEIPDRGALKREEHKPISNVFPTFQRRCHKIGITVSTMYERIQEHKEFSEAYIKAKQIQEAILLENGLQGVYNPAFAMFLAKNNFGYKDKQEVEQTTINLEITDEQKKKLLERFTLDE